MAQLHRYYLAIHVDQLDHHYPEIPAARLDLSQLKQDQYVQLHQLRQLHQLDLHYLEILVDQLDQLDLLLLTKHL